MSRTLASYTLAILNAASGFGRTIPNLLADHFGKFNVFVPICLMTGILICAVFGIANNGGVIVFSILYGFASGAFVSLVPLEMATLAPDITQIGIYMCIGFFLRSFANLTGTPINGALLEDNEYATWSKPIVFSDGTIMAGTAAMVDCRAMLVKRRGHRLYKLSPGKQLYPVQ